MARGGDQQALDQLLRQHEPELAQVIAWQLDPRLKRREDASDLVQETLLTAAKRLDEFVDNTDSPPFRIWLRMIARDRVADAHRKHLGAQRRDLFRERYALPDHSSIALVNLVMGREPTPSHALTQAELVSRVNRAMGKLDPAEKELIMWRHFEQLSIKETAIILKISPEAASKRYVRALEKLRSILIRFESP